MRVLPKGWSENFCWVGGRNHRFCSSWLKDQEGYTAKRNLRVLYVSYEVERGKAAFTFFLGSRPNSISLQCWILRQWQDLLTLFKFCKDCKELLPWPRRLSLPRLLLKKGLGRTIHSFYFFSQRSEVLSHCSGLHHPHLHSLHRD